jgi:hypothetical protein
MVSTAIRGREGKFVTRRLEGRPARSLVMSVIIISIDYRNHCDITGNQTDVYP